MHDGIVAARPPEVELPPIVPSGRATASGRRSSLDLCRDVCSSDWCAAVPAKTGRPCTHAALSKEVPHLRVTHYATMSVESTSVGGIS